MIRKLLKGRNFVATVMAILASVFILDTGLKAFAQTQRKHEIKEEKEFKRPEPSRPIQPEIPSTNRFQEDKVFLEYADSLYKTNTIRDTIQRQILKGNVKFRQAGLWMFCDSAYYYPEENSLDAFSNVRMEQGDTLFVYADKLFYDGDLHLAKLKNGPTRAKVTLIDKDVTLTTDSLDYDMSIDKGWYLRWGTLDDKVNTLTSLYGEYSPRTKLAEFFQDVVLENAKDGFTMYTDTLYYSTETHIANIESRTEIHGENDTIITNLATYYTDSGNADLLSRSLIIHRDSTGNIVTLEGDSIIYDNATRISRAYMFQDPFKKSAPMVITDTAQKTTLIGGFGLYNDSTKEALATIYPLLMEYSQADTLFLRADTIKTFIITEMIPDKRRKTKSGFPEFNGNPIVKKDSTGYIWIDSVFFDVKIPYADSPLKMLMEIAPPYKQEDYIGEEVSRNSNNNNQERLSSEDVEEVAEESNPVELLKEDKDGLLIEENNGGSLIEDNNEEILIGEEYLKDLQNKNTDENDIISSGEINIIEENTSPAIIDNVIVQDSIEIPAQDNVVDSIPHEFHVVLAYHRGRFFKQDMQGIADSIVFVERDSMLYLFRKPIVWSEERQVTGNRIDVHFNDSTTDWAYLPEYGLMSEWVDEDFYNQIFGKEITAYFENQGLRRMNISGNVETIFLPQESDSTFNRLVNAESSYMDVTLTENKLDWLKMWPEVSGTVTPIFLVKRNQMYLQKFKWWGFLRPEREWYGDHLRWADNLGEVPDELDQYFLSPSDFGEPKSFTGPRIILPSSSLQMSSSTKVTEISDSVPTIVNTSDSIGGLNKNLEIPDSITTGADSKAIEDVEKTETLGDILKSEREENKDAKQTEEQTEEIEKEIKLEEENQFQPIETIDSKKEEEDFEKSLIDFGSGANEVEGIENE